MKRCIYAVLLIAAVLFPFAAHGADTYYPNEGADRWSTLAFEDNWPLQGDYDMNDLCLQYKVHTYGTGAATVSKIDFTIRIQARGASYHSGFGIQWDKLRLTDATSATLAINNGTPVTITPEAGQTHLVYLFFNDATPYAGSNPGCNYFNTEPGATTPAPQPGTRFDLSITLKQEFSIQNTLGFPPYNPFIFRTNERVREVHLAGYSPTSWALANNISSQFFGTGQDDSLNGTYYVTSQGLPWGLNFDEKWNHPLEGHKFSDVYPLFADWVMNGTNADWYLLPNRFPAQWFPFQTIGYNNK